MPVHERGIAILIINRISAQIKTEKSPVYVQHNLARSLLLKHARESLKDFLSLKKIIPNRFDKSSSKAS